MSAFKNNPNSNGRPRSRINLSNYYLGSGKAGWLMPVKYIDCVPGDIHRVGTDISLTAAPMIAPIKGKIDVSAHTFFVPYRILWFNWEKYIAGAHITDGEDQPVLPFIDGGEVTSPLGKRLLNFFGIPNQPAIPVYQELNALWLAAYNRIYADYYADERLQNLEDFEGTVLQDGPNPEAPYFLRSRAWAKDYFTTAVPEPQIGPDITIPVDLDFTDARLRVSTASGITTISTNLGNTGIPNKVPNMAPGQNAGVWPVDMSVVEAENSTTMDDFTLARSMQKWMYRLGRVGTRYFEYVQEFFGVRPSDARLQRAEYITGITQPILISEILNTAGVQGTASSNPQGTPAGVGRVPNAHADIRSYRCEEHGVLMTIMSITPRANYQQGIHKSWLRTAATDFFQPALAHIGMQPIQNQELFAYGSNPTGTFGYTDIYDDYRFDLDRTVGDFQTSLNFWTVTRIFEDEPALNMNFVEIYPEDVLRIFAVQNDTDQFWFEIVNHCLSSRPIPTFGTPMI